MYLDSRYESYCKMHNCSPVSNNEQLVLLRLAQQGNRQATEKLVASCYKFVLGCVVQRGHSEAIANDLVQEALMILVTKAIPKYDFSSGYKFISYAVYWIMVSITKYSQRNLSDFPFQIPENIAYQYLRVKGARKYESIQCVGGTTKLVCTDDTLSDDVDAYVKKKDIDNALNFSCLSDSDSFGKKEGKDDALNIFDMIGEQDHTLDIKELKNTVTELISGLPKRDKDIITKYYGLGDLPSIRAKEIGVEYGCSQQRIQQIIRRSREKIECRFNK